MITYFVKYYVCQNREKNFYGTYIDFDENELKCPPNLIEKKLIEKLSDRWNNKKNIHC